MADKPLQIHPQALAELRAAVSWYLERNERAALGFASELDRAVTLIVRSPLRWPAGSHQTHKFVIKRFPFAIIYRELEKSIQILAFAHGRRRPGYWLDRL